MTKRPLLKLGKKALGNLHLSSKVYPRRHKVLTGSHVALILLWMIQEYILWRGRSCISWHELSYWSNTFGASKYCNKTIIINGLIIKYQVIYSIILISMTIILIIMNIVLTIMTIVLIIMTIIVIIITIVLISSWPLFLSSWPLF